MEGCRIIQPPHLFRHLKAPYEALQPFNGNPS
jgi:hypothetical protein